MNLFLLAIGLCFVVPAVGYASRILWRWCTWTRVEAKVFRLSTNKSEAKASYVVGGRQRTAGLGWVNLGVAVGNPAVVRYDPERPFRYQVAKPIWRTVCMLGLAVVAGCGALIIASAATGPRSNDRVDLPWFVSMGLGLLTVAAGSGIASYQWKRRAWRRADGTITAVREQKTKDSDGTTTVTYRVTYRFVDDITEDIRTATTDTFYRSHEKGQAVPVRYDPADPDRSNISTPRGRMAWGASAAALFLIGAALIALGIGHVIRQDAL